MIRLLAVLGMAVVLAGASSAQEAAKSGGAAEGGYELSKAELALDCRKLTGRMQVRILQIRDHAQRSKSSEVSRLAQQTLTPLYGGSLYGSDPDGRYRQDIAQLQAYNRRLAEKKCPTFDLEAELKPQPVGHTPRPKEN